MPNNNVIYGLTKDFVFTEAVNFLKKKKPLKIEAYKQLSDEAKAKAFSISGYTSVTVIQEFLDELERALEEGKTKEQFREDMNDFLETHGYTGISAYHAENIFRTNMSTAMNAGHYRSMTEPTTMKLRPYWQYMTAGDGRVRDEHAAMHGLVFRASDPIWNLWYPPNGYKCRCYVVSRSARQIEKMGLKISDAAPLTAGGPVFPDKGFSGNPAAAFKPDMSNISKPLREIYKDREEKATEGEKMINEFEKNNYKNKKEAGLLIKKDGTPVEFDGIEHHIQGTASIISDMDGGKFTHNHPLDNTFSDTDIFTGIVKGNLHELRAVTSEGNIHILVNNGASLEQRRKFGAAFQQALMKANNYANQRIYRGERINKEVYVKERLEKFLSEKSNEYGFEYIKTKLDDK